MINELGLWSNVTSRHWLATFSFLSVPAHCVYPQWLHQNEIHFAANSASIHFLWDLSRCLHSAVVEQWCWDFHKALALTPYLSGHQQEKHSLEKEGEFCCAQGYKDRFMCDFGNHFCSFDLHWILFLQLHVLFTKNTFTYLNSLDIQIFSSGYVN